MKKIPILLLLAVLLASCGASVSKDKESGTQEPPRTDISESQHESISVVTTTEVTTGLHDISDRKFKDSILGSLNILTVRWGEVLEDSRHDYALREKTDTPAQPADIVCIQVEVLKVWHQSDSLRKTSDRVNDPGHSFTELHHLWIPLDAMPYIEKSETAIVFASVYHGNPANVELYYQNAAPYMFLEGFQDPYGAVDSSVYAPIRFDIYPITNDRLQVDIPNLADWTLNTYELNQYHRWLDEQNSDIPRFRDGMTLGELTQFIDSLKQ